MGLLCNEMNECAKGMDYKLTECKSDADCVFGSVHGTCDPECHHAQGKHFCLFPHSSECKEAYNEAYKCLENNGCPLVLSFVRGSCAYTSCKKAVAKVYGCKSFCGHYRSLLEGCTEKALKDRCPLFSKAVMFGSTLGVFVGIIAILITTFILARVLKTEDPYAIITDAQ